MKNGYRVVDIDTHVNPSLDTLIKYVDPGFRPRLDELNPLHPHRGRIQRPQHRLHPL